MLNCEYGCLASNIPANPDPERFEVDASDDGLAEIWDRDSGLSYTIYRAEEIGEQSGWAVLPDGLDTDDAWVYSSCRELLRLVWAEITTDAADLFSGA